VGAIPRDKVGLIEIKDIVMLNNKFLDEVSNRISQLAAGLPGAPAAEFEKNAKALLSSAFARLDLVTREEFDLQRELLVKAREKLEALEAEVAKLVTQLESRK
jgi:ubiquinone biosynthesis accessory factor UbiK